MRLILHQVPFLVLEAKGEVAEATQLVAICREYIVGLSMEVARRELHKESGGDEAPLADKLRMAEMQAYFTHCALQPAHLVLGLNLAQTTFFKLKLLKTAAAFARRLIELGPKPEIAEKTRKILKACDQAPTDAHPVAYDQHNPFVLCAASYKPVYKGSPVETCPFCAASYQPQYKGTLCTVCALSEVGKAATGLRLSLSQR